MQNPMAILPCQQQTILLDRSGIVRWIYRSGQVVARLSPDEVLQMPSMSIWVGDEPKVLRCATIAVDYRFMS